MVIDKTNETSARVFPVVLDVPDKFWESRAVGQQQRSSSGRGCLHLPAPVRLVRMPHWLGNVSVMAKLFLMSPIPSDRFQPAVR